MILGDLGAEVIKIEEPKAGDLNRQSGPFIGGEGAYFLYTNRNKKSMTLNLREEEGRDILIKLVKDADILVENYRPGVKFRLKIDYETLKEINPRLIYCSISGFGQTGPWAERPGFDQIAQGMSGLMSVTGFPGSGPTRVGVAVGDSVCGIFAASGILAALVERDRSGVGQHVQTSLLEGLVSILGFQAAKYFGTKETPLQQGNDHATNAPYGTYATRDGHVNIATGNQPMWEKLCEMLSLKELIDDARFKDMEARVRNKDVLRELLEEKLTNNDSDHWIETLNEGGVPCGPIYTLDQVFKDSQVLHQEMWFQVDHPKAGKIDLIGSPVKYSRTPCKTVLPPPYFGQHTAEILSSLEYSEEEVESLRARGIISK
jgi:formyl-CoA transferase